MAGFFKVILIIFIIYYGLKFLGKLLFPLLLKSFAKKMGSQFNANFQQQQEQQQKQEGSVTVDSVPGKEKKVDDDEGEYIDFEEIK